MAYSFDNIFEQFLYIVDDSRFVDSMTEDILAVTLSKYLYEAIAFFDDYCNKDLSDYTATSQTSCELTGDGSTTVFSLSCSPASGSSLYVSIDETENTSYSFNEDTNEITFDSAPSTDSEIYVGAYKVGEFTNDLNIQEKIILANAMSLPYLKFYMQKRLHLNQMVYGNEYGVHSQANQTKENRTTYESRRKEIMQDIMMYTYKQTNDDFEGVSGANQL
ncbi:MAG: hypothetical protein ACOCUD_04740 [Bacillota bacterium]